MNTPVQPDRPKLCRFWFAGVVSALETATVDDANFALRAVIAFVWRYTWLCVPDPLRVRLLAALRRLRPEAVASVDALRSSGTIQRALVFATMTLMNGYALCWALEGDEAFAEWRRDKGDAAVLPSHGTENDDRYSDSTMRCVAGTLQARSQHSRA